MAFPVLQDLWIVCFSFYAPVHTPVLVFAVAIIIQIWFVVFFTIRNEIVHCKSVMCCDKIDACRRRTVTFFIEIGASCKPLPELRKHPFSTFPIVTYAVAVHAIPLSPAGRKLSYLVTSFSHVPWFRDQLYLRYHRVLVNDIKKCT